MATPDVLSTAQVAALVGRSARTVLRRSQTQPRWGNCVIGQTKRSTDWSRSRLIAAGILCEEKPAPVMGMSFDAVLPSLSMRVG